MQQLKMRVVVLLCLAALSYAASSQEPTYEQIYLQGTSAYNHQDWQNTIQHMRRSVEEFSKLEEARRHCYSLCSRQRSKVTSQWVDLNFFQSILERSHCVRHCTEEETGLLPRGGVALKIFKKLKTRQGLHYLQMALHNEGMNKEAAQTFAQYYYHNPHDRHSRTNFVYYRALNNVTESDLEPNTTFKYREYFMTGDDAYYDEDWSEMVEWMEKALLEMYRSLDECRTDCTSPLKITHVLGLSQMLSQVHSAVVSCQAKCPYTLGNFRVHVNSHFFASFFNYLQYGYYHLSDTDKAVQAAATMVRLNPGSNDSLEVSKFFKKTEGVRLEEQVLKQGVLQEVLKVESIENYRRFLDNQAGHVIQDSRTGEWNVESEGVDPALLELDYQRHPVPVTMETTPSVKEEQQPEPVVVQTSDDYDGVERMMVDKLLTQEQCDQLIQLASYGKEGDGYERKSPHTENEKFEGLHLLEAAKRSSYGEIKPSLSWLYVNASRWSKDMVAKVFKLEQPLFFSYTHLVCRTSKEGKQKSRRDLSHPVHSDNCILDDLTGECNKQAPAYTWRDYSALLYLNGDFEGGEFFYAHSTKDLSPDVLVKPECGRLVGFSAGKENMHGVLPVTGGRRCAVALWFTLDPKHSEAAFDQAEDLLVSL